MTFPTGPRLQGAPCPAWLWLPETPDASQTAFEVSCRKTSFKLPSVLIKSAAPGRRRWALPASPLLSCPCRPFHLRENIPVRQRTSTQPELPRQPSLSTAGRKRGRLEGETPAPALPLPCLPWAPPGEARLRLAEGPPAPRHGLSAWVQATAFIWEMLPSLLV